MDPTTQATTAAVATTINLVVLELWAVLAWKAVASFSLFWVGGLMETDKSFSASNIGRWFVKLFLMVLAVSGMGLVALDLIRMFIKV